jgi:hypothetical protein
MYRTALGIVGATLALLQPLQADDKASLLGTWKLASFVNQVVGENTPAREVWGPNPKGYLIFGADGRMMTITMASGRNPPTNDAESVALLKSMNAYTGKYTIEGDKWTTIVDAHHNETYVGHPQVRYFKVEGDKLTVRVPDQPSALFPGQRITATLEWIRER